MQQERRSNDGRQCGNACSGLEDQSQEVGSERKSKEEEVQGLVRFSPTCKNKASQKSCMKVVVEKLLRAGNLPSSCSGDSFHRKIKIEEADGSSSGYKEVVLSVLVHGSLWPCSGRRALDHCHPDLRRRSLDWQNGVQSNKKLG